MTSSEKRKIVKKNFIKALQFAGKKTPIENPLLDVEPKKISSALKKYREGDRTEMIKYMRQALLDAKVKAVVGQLRSGVLKQRWEIQPAKSIYSSGFQSSDDDIQRAKDTDHILRTPLTRHLMKHLFDKQLFGHACPEIIWDKQIGFHIPLRYKRTDLRFFEYYDGELFIKNDTELVKIDSDNLLPVLFEEEEDPILLPATILYFMKQYLLNLWARRTEIHGMPFRVGKYPEDVDPETEEGKALLDELQSGLDSFSEDAWAMFPEDVTIDFKEPVHFESGHKYIIDYMDEMISSSVVHQNLTSMVKNGSRSATETHAGVASDRIWDCAISLENDMNKFISILERLNWSPVVYSSFHFIRPWNSEKAKHRLDVAKTAKDNGLRVKSEFYENEGVPVEIIN